MEESQAMGIFWRLRYCAAILVWAAGADLTLAADAGQFVLENGTVDEAARILADAQRNVGAVRSSDDRLSDASLATFARWRGLYGVYLWNTEITGVGFSELAGHEHLVQVYLLGPNVNDDGVRAVSRLARVTHLSVGNGYGITNCRIRVHPALVTDRGLAGVATMARLQYLCIENSHITDAGIQQLASLKAIESIEFSRCPRLTLTGLKQLRAALPNVRIQAYTPDVEAE